jgi:acyl-CoA synthetase (NDP forming)/GNAT superfamily N-acetyltransferase
VTTAQPTGVAASALNREGSVYALLTDGSTVEIRPARPEDADAVREMHEAMSPDNLYLRFFSLSPYSGEREAQRVCRPAGPDHGALLAWLRGRLVGVAGYEPVGTAGSAEVAFAVPDDMHHHGIATLLLEHLVSLARRRGLASFTATTLLDNAAMLGVFASAGLPVQRSLADGEVQLTFPLPGDDGDPNVDVYLDSVASRESRADVASLHCLLEPRSVAVIGASRRLNTVGRSILHNIIYGGFTGPVYAVNPHGHSMEGIHCVASVEDLPEAPDLAVIAVPAAAVPAVADACGHRGVRALVVITSGLGSEAADLLAICRRYGMRLVGPNCLGVMVPAIGLNASFTDAQARPGVAGLVVQSGGVGIALLEHLSRLGVGVSSFASVGDKYDVSSNDLLTWWERDGVTRMAVLYVESFGSPRKFARTARRVGRQMPVLTVIGGRSPAGQSAAASHTAAVATPLVTQEALFGQAGIIATSSLGELIEAAALLACQPLPAGRRVAIVSNAGGAGVLAADACTDSGLAVARLGEATQSGLRGLLPAGAAVAGPVDTTPGVTTEAFRACLEQVAADDGVDAVLAVAVPTALSDLRTAVTAAVLAKPVAAALLAQAESVALLSRGEPDEPLAAVPTYAYPEGAARALGHAARYQAWRGRQETPIPEQGALEVAAARRLTAAYLEQNPAGGWLPGPQAAELAACYQIPVSPVSPVSPPGPPGAEVRARIVQEPVFGPLVRFGPGGATAGVLGDDTARLAPLTPADAADLIAESPAAPLLTGQGSAASAGTPPADTAALAGLLVRLSRLADDLPEVAELELSPLIAGPDEVRAAAIRVRLAPAERPDPFLRRLR